jgi:hypothetical protein
LPQPNSFWLDVLARLRPEIPASQAAAQIDVVYHQGISQWAPIQGKPAGFLQERHIAFMSGAKGKRGVGDQFGRLC